MFAEEDCLVLVICVPRLLPPVLVTPAAFSFYDDSFLVTGECLAVMPWPDVI